MAYFPFFIDIKDARGLIIGGGKHALGKIEKLLPYGSKLRVITPAATDAVINVCEAENIEISYRDFQEADLELRPDFVIIACDDMEARKWIAGLCRERHILVNSVDDVENCDLNKYYEELGQTLGEALLTPTVIYVKPVLAAIDAAEHGSSHIGRICEEAEKAVESCREKERNIVFYKELSVELFLNEITENSMQEYLHKLFPMVTQDELDSFMTIIAVFFEKEGSITKMAEALYMHKNTIQYKLKKLETLSGQDIRTPTGAGIYYMALSFYQKLYGTESFLRTPKNN